MSFWQWLRSVFTQPAPVIETMRLISVIEGESIYEMSDGTVTFQAKAAIDSDGIGPHHGDRTPENQTSLQFGGKSLNADVDRYIVLPPAVIRGVSGIVLGCQAFCTNVKNGLRTEAVVGDIGPSKKIGEVSVACAKALGIDPDPVHGGVTEHIVHYSIRPGVAASVEGKHYQLQAS